MMIQIPIIAKRELDFDQLIRLLAVKDLVVITTPEDVEDVWSFYRESHSTTQFYLERQESKYILCMERLASLDDYSFFPYLLDTLSLTLTDEHYQQEGQSAFDCFGEEWMSEEIGEEIAYLKCYLKLGERYFLSLPLSDSFQYIDAEALRQVGVTYHSSTPRIYGYVQYLLRHGLLPETSQPTPSDNGSDEEIDVDVPQHVSIGIVKSWQLDGAETTESYAQEDVNLLLELASQYKAGHPAEGVVLNDIGTIFEHEIGVTQDSEQALYWYQEAYRQGDTHYAPTNLGDLYRRGVGSVKKDLSKAVEAYKLSDDPYAWYRIGQSLEEGWTGPASLEEAMKYYHKAADAGHHLARKRLNL